eukprot:1239484-Pyramimonas_sp.AAC.2
MKILPAERILAKEWQTYLCATMARSDILVDAGLGGVLTFTHTCPILVRSPCPKKSSTVPSCTASQ